MPSQDTYNSALTDADQDMMACQTTNLWRKSADMLFLLFTSSAGVTRLT